MVKALGILVLLVTIGALAQGSVPRGISSKSVKEGLVSHLKVGEERDIQGLKIQALEVVEDSRCPQGAVCFWPGIIVTKIRLTSGFTVQEMYIGNTNGKSVVLDSDFHDQKSYKFHPVVFKNYLIDFEGAMARHSQNDKLAQDEYNLDFVVKKVKSPIENQ